MRKLEMSPKGMLEEGTKAVEKWQFTRKVLKKTSGLPIMGSFAEMINQGMLSDLAMVRAGDIDVVSGSSIWVDNMEIDVLNAKLLEGYEDRLIRLWFFDAPNLGVFEVLVLDILDITNISVNSARQMFGMGFIGNVSNLRSITKMVDRLLREITILESKLDSVTDRDQYEAMIIEAGTLVKEVLLRFSDDREDRKEDRFTTFLYESLEVQEIQSTNELIDDLKSRAREQLADI